MRFVINLRAECDEDVTPEEVKAAMERLIEGQERLSDSGKTIKFHKVRATQCETR